MKIIEEVRCAKCGKKQVKNIEELLQENLFWRVCEFCNRYGLYQITRRKLTSIREWMTAIYLSMDPESLEKSLLRIRK
jgi:hypothetical protein